MKDNLVHIIRLIGISCVIGILCTFILYKFFPQYLCYITYDVHESSLQEREDKLIEANAQYIETFIPACNYIKDISFNLKPRGEGNRVEYVVGTLLDDTGKVVTQSSFELQASDYDVYSEFEIEKWVDVERQYQFVMQFPDCGDIYVTFGPDDIGPEEHVSLLCNNKKSEQNMYLRYVYGCYSKKLLAIWFLVFFISTYLLMEHFVCMQKEKKCNEMGKIQN